MKASINKREPHSVPLYQRPNLEDVKSKSKSKKTLFQVGTVKQ